MRAPTIHNTPCSYHINEVFYVIVPTQTLKKPLTSDSVHTNIFMLYVAKQPEFSVGTFGVDEGLERTIQLLDGHFLLCLLVNGRTKRELNTVTKVRAGRGSVHSETEV